MKYSKNIEKYFERPQFSFDLRPITWILNYYTSYSSKEAEVNILMLRMTNPKILNAL